ncbi:class I SAM-dependent methyltransferase [Patescibacteria group bacterium]|nr:class I SAM-dependent methyltransferase [Patescibacteria group bacterium]
MRDCRLQALVNWVKLFGKKGYWDYKWLLRYGWEWIRPEILKQVQDDGVRVGGNGFLKIFDLKDIHKFRKEILKLGKFNPWWFARVFEPETKGIRAWEYGMLLNYLKRKNFRIKNKTILDVGSGGSLLADFLASGGAKVTSIDIKEPMEKRDSKEILRPINRTQDDGVKSDHVKRDFRKVKFVVGDMTKLLFKKNSFDAVICVSAIEHLDTKMNGGYYCKKEYWKRTVKALREMARVTKKNGLIYLTTDFYLEKQKTDNWIILNELISGKKIKKDKIRGAYEWKRLKMFLDELNKAGLKTCPSGRRVEMDVEKNKKLLVKNKDRSNYRGRYFTTVAFARKI